MPLVSIGAVFAWVAVIIYASSNSIVAMLVDIGRANPVAGGRNAIYLLQPSVPWLFDFKGA